MGNAEEYITLASTYDSANDLMQLIAVASILVAVYLGICLILDIRKRHRLEDIGDKLDAIHEVWEEDHGIELD